MHASAILIVSRPAATIFASLLIVASLLATTARAQYATATSGVQLGMPVIRNQAADAAPTRLPAPSAAPTADATPAALAGTGQAAQPASARSSEPMPGRLASAVQSSTLDADTIYAPQLVPWAGDFSPTPLPDAAFTYDAAEARRPYDGKSPVPVQRPLIEWGLPFFLNGMIPRSQTFLGETNLVQQHFYMYGDYRIGYGGGRNAGDDFHNMATQFRLDFDWGITSTERFHAFMQPFNRNGNATGVNFVNDDFEAQEAFNVDFITGFFEGDLGAITGGLTDTWYPFDLPFTAGLIPLLYQNGIWMDDAVAGAAFALPSKNSKFLRWSNFDATFFAAVDQINSDAFPGDKNAAHLFGTAWFIEAYEGYIETGYAYVDDRTNSDRSYHNMTLSFARRYFWRVANTVRVIGNFGQDLPREQRTADGALVLIENAWVSRDALRFVPYLNAFAGFGRPQSVARAAAAGGVLRNTGINFETDGINGFPTLDATANNTYGGAVGINLLGPAFDHQLVVEAAYVGVMDNPDDRKAAGEELAFGTRYQIPISHRTLIRLDGMWAWRDNASDLTGGRIEYRWKF
ncbi:hypothetical protein EC9_13340 [Rosistilla ulvae]|uniref:Porin subfamily protein n=1 Tax=Rosistilla ulvae TaxID=1930277 RepID=A0A517LX11_9BACT|nr:hypothetical protein [Rosistilla ulvae]QDS87157.1 hypothetical protein EC9_13340 [Rosistilla ulvae]